MKPDTDLRQALRACRGAGFFLFAFSLGINILALASPLYMMQLYDRVVSSRSVDTLIMLTLMFALAIGALVVLDTLRGQVLARLGTWLDERLGPTVIVAGLRASLATASGGRASEALRDLMTVRSFLSGPATMPLMDAPWAPLFIGLLYILHPLLGMVGLASGFVLFALAVLNEAITKNPLQQANRAAARTMRTVESAFRNAEVVEAMGMRDGVLRIWRREAHAGKLAQELAGNRAALVQGLSKYTRLMVQSAIMGVGAWLVIEDHAPARSQPGAERRVDLGRIHADGDHSRVGDLRVVLERQKAAEERLLLGAPPPSVELQHGGIAAHELGQPTLVSGVVQQLEVGDPAPDSELADSIRADGPLGLARAVCGVHRARAGTRLVSSANAK